MSNPIDPLSDDSLISAAARAEAMRRATSSVDPEPGANADAQYHPYAPTGGILDWISSLLPDALSGRSAVMHNRARLKQIDEDTRE